MADIPKIPDREITPPSVYANRRAFMRAGVAARTVVVSGSLYRLFNPIKHINTNNATPVELQAATESEADLLARGWRVDEDKTPEQGAWTGAIHFLIVAKTEQDLIFRDELRWLQSRHPNLHVSITLTRTEPQSMWTGNRGRATAELMTQVIPNLTQLPVYLCSPNEMMDATTELLLQLGVPSSQIHTEAFAGKKSLATNAEASTVPPEESAPVIFSAATTATPKQTAKGGAAAIRFSRSGRSTQVDADTTILEVADALSIEIPYECRSGICGQCKTRLLGGTVQMDCEDALSAAKKASGFALACQARPPSDVNAEA